MAISWVEKTYPTSFVPPGMNSGKISVWTKSGIYYWIMIGKQRSKTNQIDLVTVKSTDLTNWTAGPTIPFVYTVAPGVPTRGIHTGGRLYLCGVNGVAKAGYSIPFINNGASLKGKAPYKMDNRKRPGTLTTSANIMVVNKNVIVVQDGNGQIWSAPDSGKSPDRVFLDTYGSLSFSEASSIVSPRWNTSTTQYFSVTWHTLNGTSKIYSSLNGINWLLHGQLPLNFYTAKFNGAHYDPATSSFWLIGGAIGKSGVGQAYLREVWKSYDLITWIRETDIPASPAGTASDFHSFSRGGKLYVASSGIKAIWEGTIS
jgi:hypothetical protein